MSSPPWTKCKIIVSYKENIGYGFCSDVGVLVALLTCGVPSCGFIDHQKPFITTL